jgi:integrase
MTDQIPHIAFSMADLNQRLKQDEELTSSARRDGVSAIQRLCRFADTTPAMVPASVHVVKQLLERINPVYCDITPRTFQNMVSLVRNALNRYRADQRDDRPAKFVFPPPWADLIEAAPNKLRLTVLRRFMRDCALHGLAPHDVDNATLAEFAAKLRKNVIINDENHIRNVVGAWNRASRTVPGWPSKKLSLAPSERRFTLDWDAFAPSLRDDLDAYLAFRTKPRLTSRHLTTRAAARPIKKSSAAAIRYHVRALASALVRTGIPIEKITKLSVLVDPDMAERSLNFFIERHGSELSSPQTHQLASILMTMGKIWCDLDQADLDVLGNFVKECSYIQGSMTDKNRDRLTALDDRRIRRLLFDLPRVLQALAEKSQSKRQAASHMQLALAIEILLNTAIRIGNLASLDCARHLRKATAGPLGETHLTIPKAEVKNDVEIDLLLPRELVRLITLFREKYRPSLTGGKASDFLFPVASGKSIASNRLSNAIASVTKKHVGIQLNPHVFRHFAGYLYLERHPGDYEGVRRLLGHKRISTTINYYCGKEATATFALYQETLLEARSRRSAVGQR